MEVLGVDQDLHELVCLELEDRLREYGPTELCYRPQTQSVVVHFVTEDAADVITNSFRNIDVDGKSYAIRKLQQGFPHTAELLDVTCHPDFVVLYLEDAIGKIVNHVSFAEEKRLEVSFEKAADLDKLLAKESYQIDRDVKVRVKQPPRPQSSSRVAVHGGTVSGKVLRTAFEPRNAVTITGIPTTLSKSSVELKLTKLWNRTGIEYVQVDWNPSAGCAVISFPTARDANTAVQLNSKGGEWSATPCPSCHCVADLLGDVAVHVEDISLETSIEALWCWARLATGDFAHTIIYSDSHTEAAMLFTYFSGLDLEAAQSFSTAHKMDKRRLRMTAIARSFRAQVGNLPARVTEATLKKHLEDSKVNGRKGGVTQVEIIREGVAIVTFADDSAFLKAITHKHVLNSNDLWLVPFYEEIGPIQSYQQLRTFAAMRTAVLEAGVATSIPDELIVTGFEGRLPEPSRSLRAFLSQRKMSGGGEVLSFSCSENKAVATFVDPETAQRIYQKYQLDGLQLCNCRLDVSLRSFETSGDAYKNQVLLRNIGVASEDSLRYFLWCMSSTAVDRVEFVQKDREPHLCVIAHFKEDVDFGLVARCMKAATLDGLNIEVDQVMMPTSVLARNVPQDAHSDLVEMCFGQRFAVQNVYQASSQEWIVTFQKSMDARQACLERFLYNDHVELNVSLYCEFRKEPDARREGRRGRHSVALDSVEGSVVEFVDAKRRTELDGLLKQVHCTLCTDDTKGLPVIVSSVGPTDPAYRDLAQHWPRVQRDILAFFGQFRSESLSVLPDVYKALVISEAFKNLVSESNDLTVTELRSAGRASEMKMLSIAGMPQAVQRASGQLATIVKNINDAMEREKLRTSHTIDRLADWQLSLLSVHGFREDLCSRFKDFDVTLDDQRRLVRFEGLPGHVSAASDEIHRLLNDSREETVIGSGALTALLGKDTVRAFVDGKLKESNLAGQVVWCTKSSTGVSVYGINAQAAHDAAAIFRSQIVDKSIPLDADGQALASTDKWRAAVEAMVKKCQGDLILNITDGEDNSRVVQMSCKAVDADRVVEEVQEFLRRHTMKKDFVAVPRITMKFLLKFMRDEIRQIETAQSRNFVKLTEATEGALAKDMKQSGFHIEGNGDGIINAKRTLSTIMKNQKVLTKQHDLSVPGAEIHFKSKESILLDIGDRTETVIVVAEQATDFLTADLGLCLDESGLLSAAQLKLRNGTELQVMKGDITGLQCDAIVNPANSMLQHSGGLARIIVDKGGQVIADECSAYIRASSQLNEGQAFVTRAGSLPCRKVIHAVGPQWQGGTRNEANKLFMTVQNVLTAASQHGLSSIALPPISSGIFGYPLEKCTKEIVESVVSFCESASTPIKKIILVDNKDDGVKRFKQAVDLRLGHSATKNPTAAQVFRQQPLSEAETSLQPLHESPRATDQMVSPTSKPLRIGSALLEVVEGSLDNEQADVLVNTVGSQLRLDQGALSRVINNAAGPQMQQYLNAKYPDGLAGGQIAISPGFNLPCKIVLHSCCTAWNGGAGEQVLSSILSACLEETEKQGLTSIAIPAMGTGVLQFPPSDAARITYNAVLNYCQQHPSTSIRCIKLVAFDSKVIKAFRKQHHALTMSQLDQMGQPKTPVPSSGRGAMTTDSNRTRALIGPLSVQVVHGNLSHEKVDIIVNSTDKRLSLGGQVSQSLIKDGGSAIEVECQKKGSMGGECVFLAGPGTLKCRYLLHVDADLPVERIIAESLEKAIEVKAKSISFPAIHTGVKRANPASTAIALIKAIAAFAQARHCGSLCLIRFVIFDSSMIECFTNAFTTLSSDIRAVSSMASSPQGEAALTSRHGASFSVTINICGKEGNIARAISAVEDYCRKNTEEFTERAEELGLLSDDQVDDLVQHGLEAGVAVKVDKQSGSITVSSMDRMAAQTEQQHVLLILNRHEVSKLRQESISSRFQWQYKNHKQEWCYYEVGLNAKIETAFSRGQPNVDYRGKDGTKYVVDLQLMKDHKEGNLNDACDVQRVDKELGLPSTWAAVDGYHEEVLRQASDEYAKVEAAFHLTAGANRRPTFTIIEIRRIQNPPLLKQYLLQHRKVMDGMQHNPNLPVERWLWHGTAGDSLNKICVNGFNRSYCGKNATMYGQGVYFARDAAYSAHPTYSVPNAAGQRCMIYSQVLTGEFEVGNQLFRVPNAKAHNPSVNYDTTVDNLQNPSIFVTYHDAQAYPAYVVIFQ